MNMGPLFEELAAGVFLRPGDETYSKEHDAWLPIKCAWGDRAKKEWKYRRHVYQKTSVPWLERQIAEDSSRLMTELSKEKHAYQVEAVWKEFASTMQMIHEGYSKIAEIEQLEAELASQIKAQEKPSSQSVR